MDDLTDCLALATAREAGLPARFGLVLDHRVERVEALVPTRRGRLAFPLSINML